MPTNLPEGFTYRERKDADLSGYWNTFYTVQFRRVATVTVTIA